MTTTDTEALSCQELVELVTDYLEGALEPADRLRFDSHIAGCVGCTRYPRAVARNDHADRNDHHRRSVARGGARAPLGLQRLGEQLAPGCPSSAICPTSTPASRPRANLSTVLCTP